MGRLRGTVRAKASAVFNAAHNAKMAGYSWNVFRYLGDGLHLFGLFALLATLYRNRSCMGISRTTQVFYCLVFSCRYLDLVDHNQTAYLVIFKLVYIISSVVTLIIFAKLDKTYERQKDTCSIPFVLIPCAVVAMLMAEAYS